MGTAWSQGPPSGPSLNKRKYLETSNALKTTDPNAAGPSAISAKEERSSKERPFYTVEEECFDNVKAETKQQMIELLLSEESQKGWPSAVVKHGFDCWLRREGGDQKELVRKWLPHNVWRSVFIVVEDQVTAVAMLCHNDVSLGALRNSGHDSGAPLACRGR